MSGDWFPGRLTPAERTFQDRVAVGLQLGRAGQTCGRLPQGNQPRRMPAVGPGATGPPLFNKAFSRLARSWAEMVTGTADFPEQSTSPMTPSRPRRNRHTQEKLTPRSVGALITRSLMRYPGISG